MYLLGLCAVLRFNINQGYILPSEETKTKTKSEIRNLFWRPVRFRGAFVEEVMVGKPSCCYIRSSNSLIPRDLRCSLRRCRAFMFSVTLLRRSDYSASVSFSSNSPALLSSRDSIETHTGSLLVKCYSYGPTPVLLLTSWVLLLFILLLLARWSWVSNSSQLSMPTAQDTMPNVKLARTRFSDRTT